MSASASSLYVFWISIIFLLLTADPSILILSIFFGFATYLHNCDLGYMFFLHVSRLYHLDFSKKKIESVAGLKSREIFFLIVLNLQMVCPILILTQLFCTFAAHLYRVMLLQYFSCLLGDTIVIKLKMVSWNWCKKKLGWLSLPFLYIWTFYIATVLKYGCIWKTPC